MSSRADYCVFIGRFQPIHTAHLKIIANALEEEADKLILVVGSYRAPQTLKNPWSFGERRDQIREALPREHWDKTLIVPVRDYLYSDLTWLTGIQNVVSQVVEAGASVKIIGHFKDASSYYLKLFPQWELKSEPNYFGANSTDIRSALFEGSELPNDIIPGALQGILEAYKTTEWYQMLRGEHEFLKKYRKRWESAPFPPVFVTTDAVVVQAGHVLVVRRKMNPGKGMLALPGGFVTQREEIFDGALRELKEETNILFPREELRKCLKGEHVFDHPSRDARGRTITHGFYFEIERLGPLPAVKGGDDASEALWLPISDLTLHEEEFYSDHLHIISYFVHGVGR